MGIAAQNLQAAGGTALGGNDAPTGKVFSAKGFIDGERYRVLDRRQQYYDCSHHDFKRFDFDGRLLMTGRSELTSTQPMLTEKASFYVPLRMRRPSAPYRLAKAIVNAFTNFVFGEGRFPEIQVAGDEDSQDFLQTCSKVGDLPLVMVQARNFGGSTGTCGVSWSYVDGKPRYRCHRGKNLFVQEWEDREALIPSHVTECFIFQREEWDPKRRVVCKVNYWHRRDWTSDAEVVFRPIRIDPDEDEEPDWEANVDVDKSVAHNDGDPHFVWIQNLPSDEEDGLPDYADQYESLDELDTLISVLVRGAKLNLDPTLVIKEDKLMVQRMGIKKGSDNALVVDKEGGDAKYLELSGSSIEAGIKLVNEVRRYVLEACECVIPDPEQIAADGTSSLAMKMIYERMLSKGGVVQGQYGSGLKRLMGPQLMVAQARTRVPVTVVDEDGNEEDVPQKFSLPPRVEKKPVLGDDGMPTGEHYAEQHERHPGDGEHVDLEWPTRFPPTPQDQQMIVTTLTTAVPQMPVMSQQSAVEMAAKAFGRDPAEEWKRAQADKQQQKQEEQQAMQDSAAAAGGQVGAAGKMPPGAKPGGGGATPPKPGEEKPDPPAEPPAD